MVIPSRRTGVAGKNMVQRVGIGPLFQQRYQAAV